MLSRGIVRFNGNVQSEVVISKCTESKQTSDQINWILKIKSSLIRTYIMCSIDVSGVNKSEGCRPCDISTPLHHTDYLLPVHVYPTTMIYIVAIFYLVGDESCQIIEIVDTALAITLATARPIQVRIARIRELEADRKQAALKFSQPHINSYPHHCFISLNPNICWSIEYLYNRDNIATWVFHRPFKWVLLHIFLFSSLSE